MGRRSDSLKDHSSLRIKFFCVNFSNCQVPDGDHERSDKDFEAALAAIRELQHARLVMCKPGGIFLSVVGPDCYD